MTLQKYNNIIEQRKPLQCQNSPKNCKKKHTQKNIYPYI